jgi:flagellar protein FliS
MAASPHGAKLAAYTSASTHGGVAAADPHKLIVMLMDGAIERIATARGCMERNDIGGKAQLLNRAIQIIGELRGSLDLTKGAEIAANLDALYDYVCRRILQASLKNSPEMLDEVSKLLREVRSAWAEIAKVAVPK